MIAVTFVNMATYDMATYNMATYNAPAVVRRHRIELVLAVLPFFLLAAVLNVVAGTGSLGYLVLGAVVGATVATGAGWILAQRSVARVYNS